MKVVLTHRAVLTGTVLSILMPTSTDMCHVYSAPEKCNGAVSVAPGSQSCSCTRLYVSQKTTNKQQQKQQKNKTNNKGSQRHRYTPQQRLQFKKKRRFKSVKVSLLSKYQCESVPSVKVPSVKVSLLSKYQVSKCLFCESSKCQSVYPTSVKVPSVNVSLLSKYQVSACLF